MQKEREINVFGRENLSSVPLGLEVFIMIIVDYY
jgi:hypothetical protein